MPKLQLRNIEHVRRISTCVWSEEDYKKFLEDLKQNIETSSVKTLLQIEYDYLQQFTWEQLCSHAVELPELLYCYNEETSTFELVTDQDRRFDRGVYIETPYSIIQDTMLTQLELEYEDNTGEDMRMQVID